MTYRYCDVKKLEAPQNLLAVILNGRTLVVVIEFSSCLEILQVLVIKLRQMDLHDLYSGFRLQENGIKSSSQQCILQNADICR